MIFYQHKKQDMGISHILFFVQLYNLFIFHEGG